MKRSSSFDEAPILPEDFLAAYDEGVQETALQARRLILECLPQAVERVHPGAKTIVYSLAGQTVCTLAPLRAGVRLAFAAGLPDPQGVLQAGRLRLNNVSEVNDPALRALLLTAGG